MAAVLGNREAAVTRELTKKFEEVVTGRLDALAQTYAEIQPKGEIVIIVGPPDAAPPPSAEDIDSALRQRLLTMRVKDAAAEVATALGRPGKQVHARALNQAGKA